MNTYCLIISLLFALTVQQSILLSSNLNNAIIVQSPNAEAGLSVHYNTNLPNYVGSGAQWLWKQGQTHPAAGVSYIFESVFYASCTEPAVLSISADDTFQVNVNDGPLLNGQAWQNKYDFTLNNLKCGQNIVRLKITNLKDNTPAGVVFAITQEQSNCFQCSSNGYYNRKTCQCECFPKTAECSANPDFIFQAYPSCIFKCADVKTCPNNQYFNPSTCACECNHTSCSTGWHFEDDTCQCVKNQATQSATSQEI